MDSKELSKTIRSNYAHTSSFISGLYLMIGDAIALMLCIGIGFFIVNAVVPRMINFKSFVNYSIYLPLIFVVFYSASLYPGILLAPQEACKRFSLCTFFSFMGIGISIALLKTSEFSIPIIIALFIAWLFATILLPLNREIVKHIYSRFKWWGVPAIIYTKGDNANIIIERLQTRKYYGYKPVLIVTEDSVKEGETFLSIPKVNMTEEVFGIIKKLHIKVAVICEYETDLEKIQNFYRYIIRVPHNQIITNMSLNMKDFGGILGFSSTNYLTKFGSLFQKRLIDIVLCLIASPIVLPLCLIIALLVKLTSKGPVFYGHKRIGQNHKIIKCWKFRSMCIDAEDKLNEILKNDPVRAAEWEKDRKFTDDPRVTKFGRFLRKTSLDELPQLWNIFIGQMSFVGPRPVTEPELAKYGKYADYILSVKPGLSGMWQTSGRSDTGYEERINLDTYYIQNWSLWLDIWIITKTVWVVLKGKGAY